MIFDGRPIDEISDDEIDELVLAVVFELSKDLKEGQCRINLLDIIRSGT